MAKDFARQFYNSSAWKSCREEYKKQQHYLCERCQAKGLIVPGVIVHHKRRVSPETIEDPSVLLNFDNLELLCVRCHNEEHADEIKEGSKSKQDDWRRYTIGENGEVIMK